MSTTLYAVATGLAAVTLAVHILAGGVRVVRPLFSSDLPEQLKGFLYLGWHSATTAIGAICLCFTAAATEPERRAYAWMGVGLASALVLAALFTAIRLKLSLLRFPVIPLFALVAAAGLAGLLV